MDPQIGMLLQMIQTMRREDAPGTEGEARGIPTALLLEMLAPFMPPSFQKNMNTLHQVQELNRSLTEYGEWAINRCEADGSDCRCELLLSVKPYMSAERQRMIDVIVRMIEIQNILRENR